MFAVEWNRESRQGNAIAQTGMKVRLRQVGQALAWTGDGAGVLWECYFDGPDVEDETHLGQLAGEWQAVEASMGVGKILTLNQEPTVERETYRQFLIEQGCAPEADGRWWGRVLR